MARRISSWRSPRPSMMPLLVATLPFTMALAFFRTVRLRWYWARERTSGVRRSTVSRLWLKMCGRASITIASAQSRSLKSGHEHLDDDLRIRLADGLDGLFEMLRSAVAQIVAGHGGDDDVAEIHPAGGLGDAVRFVGFERVGLGGFHGAESAGAGAFFAGDHEGGGALAPAFPAVRALGFLADGDQFQVGDQRLGGPERRIVRQAGP